MATVDDHRRLENIIEGFQLPGSTRSSLPTKISVVCSCVPTPKASGDVQFHHFRLEAYEEFTRRLHALPGIGRIAVNECRLFASVASGGGGEADSVVTPPVPLQEPRLLFHISTMFHSFQAPERRADLRPMCSLSIIVSSDSKSARHQYTACKA